MQNKWELVKGWISYLKSLRIVELNSDPTTGKLIYRRQPTVEDLYKYLTTTAGLDAELAREAIQNGTAKPSSTGVKEAIRDVTGRNITEAEIEKVFDLVVSLAATPKDPAPAPADPQEDMKKIRRFIRDEMPPDQIMALWRALKNA